MYSVHLFPNYAQPVSFPGPLSNQNKSSHLCIQAYNKRKTSNAQSSYIAALVEYQISLVDLAYATGTLLEAAQVKWDDAENIK